METPTRRWYKKKIPNISNARGTELAFQAQSGFFNLLNKINAHICTASVTHTLQLYGARTLTQLSVSCGLVTNASEHTKKLTARKSRDLFEYVCRFAAYRFGHPCRLFLLASNSLILRTLFHVAVCYSFSRLVCLRAPRWLAVMLALRLIVNVTTCWLCAKCQMRKG